MAQAWVSDMFGNFYLVKNHKIANNSATNKAREKLSAHSESVDFLKSLNFYFMKLATDI